MVVLLSFVQGKAVDNAASSSSNEHVKTLPFSLMLSMVVGFLAGLLVTTNAKSPSFDPNVAEPSLFMMQSRWLLSIRLVLILVLRLMLSDAVCLLAVDVATV